LAAKNFVKKKKSYLIILFCSKLVTVEGFIITNQKQQVQRQVSTKVTTAGATHQQCIIPVTSSHQTVCAKSISQAIAVHGNSKIIFACYFASNGYPITLPWLFYLSGYI
uniref:Ovule protein n=1 Tax=Brugia pahangi TaxID=6280 RepID=A0A0N4TEM7_BRUPA